jgi:hypothetical protein
VGLREKLFPPEYVPLAFSEHWPIKSALRLHVYNGGLQHGSHQVELTLHVRNVYMQFATRTGCCVVTPSGHCSCRGGEVGVTVDVRLNYYRGMPLSSIERLELSIDGERVPTSMDSTRYSSRSTKRSVKLYSETDDEIEKLLRELLRRSIGSWRWARTRS